MDSALEHYIHLHWEDYQLAGTYRTTGNFKERFAEKSNYNPSLFDRYAGAVRLESKYIIENIGKNALKTLENNYNESRKNNYNALKNLNDDVKQIIFTKVVENANLGKNINAATLAQYITFDDTINNIKTELRALQQTQFKKISYPKLAGKDYVNWSTLQSAFSAALGRAELIEDNSMKADIKKIIDEKYKEVTTALSAHNETIEMARKEGVKLDSKLASGRRNAFSREVGDEILSWLKDVTSVVDGIQQLAKLQASFAEIMGVLASDDISKIAKTTLIDKLCEIPGATRTGNHIKADSLDIFLPQELYAPYIEKDKDKAEQFKSLVEFKDPQGLWRYAFKMNHKTQQKVDFMLEYNGKNIGINLKAYDMSQEFKTKNGEKIANTIKLHSGTSFNQLRKALDDQGAHFGSHLMNVLSINDADSNILTKAKQSLYITLLYMALTGAGWGKDDPLAEIFVVEDKNRKLQDGVNRVRFYNIYSLLNSFFDDDNININTNGIQIEPTLDNLISVLRKANTIVDPEATSQAARERAIRYRLFNIVEAARSEKLQILINIAYLNQQRALT